MTNLLMLILGFAILIFEADKFVDGARLLACKLRVPSAIIG